MFFILIAQKILETWNRNSSSKYFSVVRTEKQICSFVSWEKLLLDNIVLRSTDLYNNSFLMFNSLFPTKKSLMSRFDSSGKRGRDTSNSNSEIIHIWQYLYIWRFKIELMKQRWKKQEKLHFGQIFADTIPFTNSKRNQGFVRFELEFSRILICLQKSFRFEFLWIRKMLGVIENFSQCKCNESVFWYSESKMIKYFVFKSNIICSKNIAKTNLSGLK